MLMICPSIKLYLWSYSFMHRILYKDKQKGEDPFRCVMCDFFFFLINSTAGEIHRWSLRSKLGTWQGPCRKKKKSPRAVDDSRFQNSHSSRTPKLPSNCINWDDRRQESVQVFVGIRSSDEEENWTPQFAHAHQSSIAHNKCTCTCASDKYQDVGAHVLVHVRMQKNKTNFR